MPFLAALAPILAGLGGVIGGVGALKSGSAAGKAANADVSLLNQEKQQQAQEYANMMQLFGKLTPFFEQYMGQGSPILNQVQRGSAEQLAHDYAGARGTAARNLRTSGYGAAPSGVGAGMFGDMAAEEATTGSQNYLTNLLANEATKFQAASGLQSEMATMKPSQVQPIQQLPINNTGAGYQSIASGLAQILKTAKNPSGTGTGTSAPTTTSPTIPFLPPTTYGYGDEYGGM